MRLLSCFYSLFLFCKTIDYWERTSTAQLDSSPVEHAGGTDESGSPLTTVARQQWGLAFPPLTTVARQRWGTSLASPHLPMVARHRGTTLASRLYKPAGIKMVATLLGLFYLYRFILLSHHMALPMLIAQVTGAVVPGPLVQERQHRVTFKISKSSNADFTPVY